MPPAVPSVNLAWDARVEEIDRLASFLVQNFVEGTGRYPVLRWLARLRMDDESEELFAGAGRGAFVTAQTPVTWSDLPVDKSRRLFYKMSLTMRCNELVYLFAEMVNICFGLADSPRCLLSFLGLDIRDICICCGFVQHQYQTLSIMDGFGVNY